MIIRPARRKQLNKYLIAVALPLLTQSINPSLTISSLSVGLIALINAEYNRYKNKFIVNDNEIIIEKGLINKLRTSVSLRNVVQIRVKQNLFQRLMNYGHLEIETKSTPLMMNNIKRPEIIAKRIKKLIKDQWQ